MNSMAYINNNLNDILIGKNELCCLCYKTLGEDAIFVQDVIFYNSNNTQYFVEMSKILYEVLGNEASRSIAPLDSLCKKCTQTSINSYKFIKMCKENFLFLSNTLNGLTNCISKIHNENHHPNTVYVSVNSKDFKCKHYFDKAPVQTRTEALTRFYSVLNQRSKRNDIPEIIYDDTSDFDVRTDIEEAAKPKQRLKLKKNKTNVTSTYDMMLDKNDSVIKCKICLKTWSNHISLRNHYIRVHAPKHFKCPHCHKSYGSASFLKQHNYECHCLHICIECGKTYSNRQSLKSHEMSHKMKLICQTCGRMYKTRLTYKKHIELNTCGQTTRRPPDQGKFICDICNKRFTHKTSLRVHITFEHGNGKSHVCTWCNKKFYAQSRLKAHVVKHTQEKNFSCELCGGRFVTKESLLYHTRIHTGERPYKCHLCEQTFLSSSRRAEHVRRHHTEPSLECEICHSKFKSRSSLQRHKNRHFNPSSRLHCSRQEQEGVEM